MGYERKTADFRGSFTASGAPEHRELMFTGRILEYRLINGDDTIQSWQDVHPVIEEMEQFQAALAKLERG